MSEWITERRPVVEDAPFGFVWVTQFGVVLLTHWGNVSIGEAWKAIDPPEPYVKPKRFRITPGAGEYFVYDSVSKSEVADTIPTREAAEQIAAIYEEVMP